MAIDFPNSPVDGQVFIVGAMSWTYTVAGGGVWQATLGGGRAFVGDSPPTSPVKGDTWFESDTGSFYVYYDGFWIEVGYPASPVGGGRNRVINGAFDIWQRGGGPFTANGSYGADQWVQYNNGSTQSVTRQAFPLGNTIPGYEPTYFWRTVVTSVANANNYAQNNHFIESVRSFAGQTVTVSFWAKADAAKNVALELKQDFGAGGSPSAAVLGIGSQLIPLTTAWQRFSRTIAIPSIAGKTLGTAHDGSLQVSLWFDAGSAFAARSASLGQQSGTFDIWGVQVEAGGAATPFEVKPPGDVMADCERYFQRISAPGFTNLVIATGMVLSGSQVVMPIQHNATMRAAPTPSISALAHWGCHDSGGTGKVLTTFAPQRSSLRQSYVFLAAAGLTAGQAATLVQMDANGYIDLSAEL